MDIFLWILVIIGAVGYLFSGGNKHRKRRNYQSDKRYPQAGRDRYPQGAETVKENNMAERQLATVRSSEFRKRTLMNKSEYGVYCQLEALLSISFPSLRVFAQVSLGEILGSDTKAGYWAINSKRADFVIIDRIGQPVAVVEYHGSGHFQGDAVTRDAVKREACQRADIGFIELSEKYTQTDIIAVGNYLAERAA